MLQKHFKYFLDYCGATVRSLKKKSFECLSVNIISAQVTFYFGVEQFFGGRGGSGRGECIWK